MFPAVSTFSPEKCITKTKKLNYSIGYLLAPMCPRLDSRCDPMKNKSSNNRVNSRKGNEVV